MKEAKSADRVHTSPVNKKIQAIIQAFVQVFDLYKPHIAVFYQESNYLKPEYEVLIKRKRDEFKQLIFAVINEGQEAGYFAKNCLQKSQGWRFSGWLIGFISGINARALIPSMKLPKYLLT